MCCPLALRAECSGRSDPVACLGANKFSLVVIEGSSLHRPGSVDPHLHSAPASLIVRNGYGETWTQYYMEKASPLIMAFVRMELELSLSNLGGIFGHPSCSILATNTLESNLLFHRHPEILNRTEQVNWAHGFFAYS